MGFNFGMGLDVLFGGAGPKAKRTGGFVNQEDLGESFSKFLQERLEGDVTDDPRFQQGSQAIRDALGNVSATQRQRLGDTSIAGGFRDSGVVDRGLGDIDRAEMQSFASAIRDLVMGFESERGEGVLPYLAGGAQENVNIFGLNQQRAAQARGQNMELFSSLFGSVMGG